MVRQGEPDLYSLITYLRSMLKVNLMLGESCVITIGPFVLFLNVLYTALVSLEVELKKIDE